MAWVKLDEKFHWHPKSRPLSDAAYRIFIGGLCYCNLYQTDGKLLLINIDMVTAGVTPNRIKAAIEELIGPWWARIDEGFEVLNYLEYQFSKAQLADLKDKRAAAGAKGGKANGKANREASAWNNPEAFASPLLEARTVPYLSIPVEGLANPHGPPVTPDQRKLAVRVVQWWCDRQGWDLGMPAAVSKKEHGIAIAFAAMPLTEDLLFVTLNEVWMAAKKKPLTLNYFSSAMERAVSENKDTVGVRGFEGLTRLGSQ